MRILEAGNKEFLWHRMRADLEKYIPGIKDTNLAMCCCCGRFISYSNFSLEHIIPEQSLNDDPNIVKQKVSRNKRSGNILLCQKELRIKGETFYRLGCNSFKGKNYDRNLREVFNRTVLSRENFQNRHHISLVAAAYLAMFSEYGYQVCFTQSGILTRGQFFNPREFLDQFPTSSQIVIFGEKPAVHDEDLSVWEHPFSFSFEQGTCFIAMRGLLVLLPMSRDPSIPIAQTLPFSPSRYRLKPDFRTVFE